jgi:hypothetical protein
MGQDFYEHITSSLTLKDGIKAQVITSTGVGLYPIKSHVMGSALNLDCCSEMETSPL